MNRTWRHGSRWGLGVLVLALVGLGCDGGAPVSSRPGAQKQTAPAASVAKAPAPKAPQPAPVKEESKGAPAKEEPPFTLGPGPETAAEEDPKVPAEPPKIPDSTPAIKRVPLSPTEKNVWLEFQGKERRVVVRAAVCLQKAGFGLECLLCRKGSKEHESILATEADARLIHLGLVAAGAAPGKVVEYEPQFKPPSGMPIKITLEYEDKGKTVRVPAQHWIRNVKTKKDLEHDWVFAGSKLIQNPVDDKKPPVYLAQMDGGYICISNVPTAMLDLPIDSPKGIEDRGYDTHEKRIPAVKTKVLIILEPAAQKK